MDGSQAIATFPGVERIIGGTLTWGHGESAGRLRLPNRSATEPAATYRRQNPIRQRLHIFNDCRIVDASYRRDSSGQMSAHDRGLAVAMARSG